MLIGKRLLMSSVCYSSFVKRIVRKEPHRETFDDKHWIED